MPRSPSPKIFNVGYEMQFLLLKASKLQKCTLMNHNARSTDSTPGHRSRSTSPTIASSCIYLDHSTENLILTAYTFHRWIHLVKLYPQDPVEVMESKVKVTMTSKAPGCMAFIRTYLVSILLFSLFLQSRIFVSWLTNIRLRWLRNWIKNFQNNRTPCRFSLF